MKSSDIHIRANKQEMPQPSITKICLKSLKVHSNFPGVNELTPPYPLTPSSKVSCRWALRFFRRGNSTCGTWNTWLSRSNIYTSLEFKMSIIYLEKKLIQDKGTIFICFHLYHTWSQSYRVSFTHKCRCPFIANAVGEHTVKSLI